jgi:hypothetical protein
MEPCSAQLLAHVAGVPVEEVLPGLLACGAAGVALVTINIRRRLDGRARRRRQDDPAR